ncbi:MAG: hypothetical protein AAGI07_00245 [Bacteroidota bacterium]
MSGELKLDEKLPNGFSSPTPVSSEQMYFQYMMAELQSKVSKYEHSSDEYKALYEKERAKVLQLENKLAFKDQEQALAIREEKANKKTGLGEVGDFLKSERGTAIGLEILKAFNSARAANQVVDKQPTASFPDDFTEDTQQVALWHQQLAEKPKRYINLLLNKVEEANILQTVPAIINFLKSNSHEAKTKQFTQAG